MIGLYMARSALLLQQAKVEVIGNNLANQKTVGFKRDETVQRSFAEMLVYQINPSRWEELPGPPGRRLVGGMAHNIALDGVLTSFAEGPLVETGRSLDFALVGDGYFRVQAPEGFLYTRNGRFFLDEAGRLVTAEGYLVWGESGPIVAGSADLIVTKDGVLYAAGEESGRLQLVSFALEMPPVKSGGNYFLAPEDGAFAESTAQVWSGFLESSNVDLTKEMVKLMEVRRCYEAMQKLVSTYNSLLSKAANELGSLK